MSPRRVREPGAEDVVAVLREREAPSGLRGVPPEIGVVDSPVGRGAAEGQALDLLRARERPDAPGEKGRAPGPAPRAEVERTGTSLRRDDGARIERAGEST